jgi:hypothetical protein
MIFLAPTKRKYLYDFSGGEQPAGGLLAAEMKKVIY